MAVRRSTPSGSPYSGPPYWLIRDGLRGDGAWDFEALSVELEEEKILTVFTEEGRAEMFAWLVVMEDAPRAVRGGPVQGGSGGRFGAGDLRPKSCGAGELVSLLVGGGTGRGPCAGVRQVALDPPPEILFVGELDGLEVDIPRVSRDAFAERLIEWDCARFDDAEWATERDAERNAERDAAERATEPEKG